MAEDRVGYFLIFILNFFLYKAVLTNDEYSNIGDGYDFLLQKMLTEYGDKYLSSNKDAYPLVSTHRDEKKVTLEIRIKFHGYSISRKKNLENYKISSLQTSVVERKKFESWILVFLSNLNQSKK